MTLKSIKCRSKGLCSLLSVRQTKALFHHSLLFIPSQQHMNTFPPAKPHPQRGENFHTVCVFPVGGWMPFQTRSQLENCCMLSLSMIRRCNRIRPGSNTEPFQWIESGNWLTDFTLAKLVQPIPTHTWVRAPVHYDLAAASDAALGSNKPEAENWCTNMWRCPARCNKICSAPDTSSHYRVRGVWVSHQRVPTERWSCGWKMNYNDRSLLCNSPGKHFDCLLVLVALRC